MSHNIKFFLQYLLLFLFIFSSCHRTFHRRTSSSKKFEHAEHLFKHYLAFHLSPRYPKPKLFWQDLRKKSHLFKKAKKAFLHLSNIDNIPQKIRAQTRLGDLYLHFATVFYRSRIIGLDVLTHRLLAKQLRRKNITPSSRRLLIELLFKKTYPNVLKMFRLKMLHRGNQLAQLAIKAYKKALQLAQKSSQFSHSHWIQHARNRLKLLKFNKWPIKKKER